MDDDDNDDTEVFVMYAVHVVGTVTVSNSYWSMMP